MKRFLIVLLMIIPAMQASAQTPQYWRGNWWQSHGFLGADSAILFRGADTSAHPPLPGFLFDSSANDFFRWDGQIWTSITNTDTVETIEQLQNYSGASTLLVLTDSMRGGLFYKSNESLIVDSGIVFNASGGGFWLRQYNRSEGVSVDWWGAKGDGTDDYNAIQKAVSHGGIVRFRKCGNYKTKYTILIGDNTVLDGNGSSIDRIDTTTFGAIFSGTNWDTALYLNNITIQNFHLEDSTRYSLFSGGMVDGLIFRNNYIGNASAAHTFDGTSIKNAIIEYNWSGFKIGNTTAFQIEGPKNGATQNYTIVLSDGRHDIKVPDTTYSNNVVFRENTIFVKTDTTSKELSVGTVSGLDIHGSGQRGVKILNNLFEGYNSSDTTSVVGIVHSSTGDTARSVYVIGNSFVNLNFPSYMFGSIDSLYFLNNVILGYTSDTLIKYYHPNVSAYKRKNVISSNNTVNGRIVNFDRFSDTTKAFQISNFRGWTNKQSDISSLFYISNTGAVYIRDTLLLSGNTIIDYDRYLETKGDSLHPNYRMRFGTSNYADGLSFIYNSDNNNKYLQYGSLQINVGGGYDIVGRSSTQAIGSSFSSIPETFHLYSSNGNASFGGTVTAEKYQLSDLNTAPANSTATGTKGEIRITSDYIYICVATNTWVRAALSTW